MPVICYGTRLPRSVYTDDRCYPRVLREMTACGDYTIQLKSSKSALTSGTSLILIVSECRLFLLFHLLRTTNQEARLMSPTLRFVNENYRSHLKYRERYGAP